MPKYFFNTRIGDDVIHDNEGVELRDPDQAWEVARTTIQDILKSEGVGPNLMNASLEVTDAGGEIVLEFPFSEALIDLDAISPTKH
jgi:predicted GNAT family acetyltransferase